MSYEILRHTADLRMRVKGRTLEELFSDAVRGMMSVLKPEVPQEGTRVRRPIQLEANDQTSLLIDFLNEVLTSAHIRREIYAVVLFRELAPIALHADLYGVPIDKFDEDIKAVTYHEAEVKKNRKGELETTLVFDI